MRDTEATSDLPSYSLHFLPNLLTGVEDCLAVPHVVGREPSLLANKMVQNVELIEQLDAHLSTR